MTSTTETGNVTGTKDKHCNLPALVRDAVTAVPTQRRRPARFRYNDLEVNAVMDELAATAAGFCEEI